MASSIRRAGLVPLLMCIAALICSVVAIPQTYCSKDNTNTAYPKSFDLYQSTGLCTGTCGKGNYKYAVLQGQYCWCSNDAPSDTEPVTDCNQKCPGFGEEQCGSTDDGLFGYIALGSAASSASSSAAALTSAARTTKSTTLSTISRIVTPSSSPSSSSSSSTSDDDSSTTSTPSSTIQQPYTSLVTITGLVQTVTITPSGEPSAVPVTTGSSLSRSPGKIVGLAIGLTILFALIIIGIVFFVLWKRRRDRRSYQSSSPASGQPMRMSSASGAGLGPDGYSRRSSTPGFTDQRLDPGALYHGQDNLSHRSFQDNQDYSRRVLKVTNPEE